MIKAIILFFGSNALWDKLVEFFGSTEAVVEVGILVVVVALIIKFHEQIIGFAIIAFILYMILR
jgi:hypothetical protein